VVDFTSMPMNYVIFYVYIIHCVKRIFQLLDLTRFVARSLRCTSMLDSAAGYRSF
jgi:hypothetical protein